ncbi:hypothetical protein CHS0354_008558 [Potamilus streckersoni]|uniref:Purple acid phosphatase n=1 Tax=Potamilus streckersoni TaxID=2493646 RepID=A0AAE0VIB9_9BIVA|nr:hypothetical protein CHS0354_008558 [Potamilus streckersoni]
MEMDLEPDWCLYLKLLSRMKLTDDDSVRVSMDTVDATMMAITWSTPDPTNASVVEYGINGFTQMVTGRMIKFVDGGKGAVVRYIHKAVMTALKPGAKYVYHCGNPKYGWSEVFYFINRLEDANWSPRIAMFGDMGNINAQSLPRLQREAEMGMYDAVLHVGDFAYDMDSDNGSIGDEFMRQIQPIASILPYMTCPGNHEERYNFSHYKNRFMMPGDEDGNNMFYSFDLGPVHFISVSTEFYFFVQYGIVQLFRQYEWLKSDLAAANKNRDKRPWIITFGHRPMYCSNNDHDDCTRYESLVRVGIPFIEKGGLEKIFFENGVDVMFWAHEHSYERLYPVFNRKVYNGSIANPYLNPKAPVHIITGSAGCQENHDGFIPDPRPWSAFRSDDYGYTRMTVINATHLYLEQVSDDKGGQVIDKLMIVKEKHGSYD